jgi:hypothetical protein
MSPHEHISPDEPVFSAEEEKSLGQYEKVQQVFATQERLVHERFAQEEFHNPYHTRGVKGNVLDIYAAIQEVLGQSLQGETLRLFEEDRLAAAFAAEGHDSKIEYGLDADPNSPFYGMRIRRRGVNPDEIPVSLRSSLGDEVGNEQDSKLESIAIARAADPAGEVFTESVLQKGGKGIEATFPALDFSFPIPQEETEITIGENVLDLKPYLTEKDGKFTAVAITQPHLDIENGSGVEIAVAIADLSYPGKVTPEDFVEAGNGEFRETRELWTYHIRNGVDSISNQEKFEIANKPMVGALVWIKSQIDFALTQKLRFADIINRAGAFTGSEKEAIKALYKNFDAAIEKAVQRHEEAKVRFAELKNPDFYSTEEGKKLFVELLREMGYGL